jgi:hypothetical protein
MAIKTTIQIEITSNNPFEAKPKMEHLKTLSKLDNDALAKLVELSKSNRAIEMLKSNFGMIQSFLN